MEAAQYRKLLDYVEHTGRIRHDSVIISLHFVELMERKEYHQAEAYMKKYSLIVPKPIK